MRRGFPPQSCISDLSSPMTNASKNRVLKSGNTSSVSVLNIYLHSKNNPHSWLEATSVTSGTPYLATDISNPRIPILLTPINMFSNPILPYHPSLSCPDHSLSLARDYRTRCQLYPRAPASSHPRLPRWQASIKALGLSSPRPTPEQPHVLPVHHITNHHHHPHHLRAVSKSSIYSKQTNKTYHSG
jgi:hypothetical protein